MTDQPDAADPDAIQHRIRQMRAGLLGGRGPGASPDEITRWQRDRPLLGAQSAAAERQRVTDEAIRARGDPEALQHLIVRHRAALSATLAELAEQLHARRRRAGAALQAAGLTLASGVVTLAIATALRRRRAERPGSDPSHRAGH